LIDEHWDLRPQKRQDRFAPLRCRTEFEKE
jgi:hypothetical protein